MHDPLAFAVVLQAWERYSANPEVTLTPMSFVRWVREEHPELARDLSEQALLAFAEELVPSRLNARTQPPR